MEFLDEPRVVSGPPPWPDDLDPPADFVCMYRGQPVDGHATSAALGGAFTHGASTVLGLRAWDDAAEGIVDGTPYALFDAEKLVRMMLHQSGLAFAILASPVLLFESAERAFPRREIFRAAVTRGLLAHFLQVTRAQLADWRAGDAPSSQKIREIFRLLLCGRALADEGVVSLDLRRLVAWSGDASLQALLDPDAKLDILCGEATAQYDALASSNAPALPEQPEDYDFLNDWLVSRRLAL